MEWNYDHTRCAPDRVTVFYGLCIYYDQEKCIKREKKRPCDRDECCHECEDNEVCRHKCHPK